MSYGNFMGAVHGLYRAPLSRVHWLSLQVLSSKVELNVGEKNDNMSVCGSKVDVFETHGLSCKRSGGRIPQHAVVNETICHVLVSGGVPAVLEPVGVCCNDGKRPDGKSLIPWSRGLPLLWDFTCSDTLAPSNLSTSASGTSRLVNSAESAKFRKYSSLIPSFHFSRLCVETLGAWGSCARSLVRWIGSQVMEQSGDNRATQFLIQKVAIYVQHGNAASVMATIPSSQDFSFLPTV